MTDDILPILEEKEVKKLTPEVMAVITAAIVRTISIGNIYKITAIKRINHDLSPNWIKQGRYDLTTNARGSAQ